VMPHRTSDLLLVREARGFTKVRRSPRIRINKSVSRWADVDELYNIHLYWCTIGV
jgi:hypothetical protein